MKKYIFGLVGISALTLFLSGCLKDKGYDNNEYQSLRQTNSAQKVVSIALTTALPASDGDYNVSLLPIDNSTSLTTINLVPIVLAGGVVAEQDVHVVVDTAFKILDDYNNSPNGTAVYDVLDVSKYSIVSKTVTIPKGQSKGYMQIRLIPNNIIGLGVFGLGVKIVSVDGGYTIAANNKGIGVAAFTVSNRYSGSYANSGIRYNYAAASVPYTYPTIPAGYASTLVLPNPKVAATLDENTTAFDFANLGAPPNSYKYIVTVPAGTTGSADVTVPLTFSSTFLAGNNSVSVKVSTYNPATKTFHFNVGYNNAATGGAYRIVDEVLTKQ